MTLTPHSRVGAFEIVGLLGAGGMGQVYRARDPRLKRDVALKILPAAVAADPDRLARFQREAEALAALNHPHIAQIYGVEDDGRVRGLVMELVEGEDLAERIAHGPLPPGEGLAIARQLADALDAAHQQGIVHRDLKPSNIKVRDDGTVKVLDFGLAKLTQPGGSVPSGSGPGLANSPTLTSPALTSAGMLLGTAAYMAPEQAKGRAVDKRADIWAFGCVCYEMLTGTRAFAGEDVTDTLAAILRGEPDWSRLPDGLSPVLVRFLRQCMEKDPGRRLRDIGDMRHALAGAFDVAVPGLEPHVAPAPRRGADRRAAAACRRADDDRRGRPGRALPSHRAPGVYLGRPAVRGAVRRGAPGDARVGGGHRAEHRPDGGGECGRIELRALRHGHAGVRAAQVGGAVARMDQSRRLAGRTDRDDRSGGVRGPAAVARRRR